MSELEPSVTFKPSAGAEDQVEINNLKNIAPVTDAHGAAADNKAFETEGDDEPTPMPSGAAGFNRMERPGSMMSIKSSGSTTSRSSVNCANGRVRCPNMRLNKFFAYKPDTGFTKASEEIRKLILPEKDGQFVGNWLLIEISNWDLHREKIVMLTEQTLFIIQYDFISSRLTFYKRITLADLAKVKSGLLKYSKGSMMGDYPYGAVKLCWGDENVSFFQKWNPASDAIPYLILSSHHILYNEKEKESEFFNCDEFIATLEYVISKLPAAVASKIEFKEEPVEIESYASIVSVLYNQNWLGFQLDRNGLNF